MTILEALIQVPTLFDVQYFGNHQTAQKTLHLMIYVYHSRMM